MVAHLRLLPYFIAVVSFADAHLRGLQFSASTFSFEDSKFSFEGAAAQGFGGSAAQAFSDFRESPQKRERILPPPVNFFRAEGPLEVELPLFGAATAQVYSDDSKLENDLANAAAFVLNGIIKTDLGVDGYSERPSWGRGFVTPSFQPESDTAAFQDSGTSPSAEGVDSFETNNQEEGVDEADAIKSDGLFVYAAYGDQLVVWEAESGDIVQRISMPSAAKPPPPVEETIEEPVDDEEVIEIPTPFFIYEPKPYIQDLMLDGDSDTVGVIVGGYGYYNYQNEQSVLTGELETKVFIYDTSDLQVGQEGSLDLIHELTLDGYYSDARCIKSVCHVVTTSSLQVSSILYRPLARSTREFQSLNDEEFEEAVTQKARDEVIPSFVDAMMEDLQDETGTVPTMARVSLWQSDLGHLGYEDLYFGDGAIQSLTRVTSFDMSLEDFDEEVLPRHTSGCFMPSSWGFTYATKDMLIFAARGWDSVGQSIEETTYLVGFALDGASSRPAAVGQTPGYMENQYHMDLAADGTHLRIVTTKRNSWGPPILGLDEPVIIDAPIIITSPIGNEGPLNANEDGETVEEPLEPPVPLRRTENQVILLRLPTLAETTFYPAVMSEMGRIPELGKDGEVVRSVRFFENVAYVVTFELTDPFYVLNLDPNSLEVLGELEITGFSSYLHSINDDNTLILGVGQEADENGRQLGVKITLFDATVPEDPTERFTYTVEVEDDVWSNSNVGWDFKAFRYVPLGEDYGIVIIPLTIRGPWGEEEGNFDGFYVLDVSAASGITERLQISHVESQNFYGCWYNGRLANRSFVFNGKLTTTKGHTVISTDLDSGETEWNFTPVEKVDQNDCVYWL